MRLLPRTLATATLVLPVLAPTPGAVAAQMRASERGSVSQTVDGTTITVDYSRPQLRGRDAVFGGIVPWGEVWTPGANWATTLTVDRPVRLEGHELPAGSYSVWMVPRQGDWSVHLVEETRLYHTQHPDTTDTFLTFDVTPREAEPVEVLSFSFPEVRRDGARLELRWGTTLIPMDVGVRPGLPDVALTEEEAAPYTGTYQVTIQDESGQSPPLDLEVALRDGELTGVVGDGMFAMRLLPTEEPHTFLLGYLEGGELVDVEEFPVVFEMADGRATGYTITGPSGLWMRAVRQGAGG